jgi:hypothetical protein
MGCPTVNICDDKNSFIVINESDFDKDKHKLFKEKPKKESKSKKAK